VNGSQCLLISGQNHDWLDGHRIVDIINGIPIWFADDCGRLGDDAACQKSGNVEFLPRSKVIANDDRDFGVEHVLLL